MRENEIIKSFGETFVATIFDNMGYEVDIVDAEGIDLACYRKGKRDRGYGVSVKTRNTQNHESFLLGL